MAAQNALLHIIRAVGLDLKLGDSIACKGTGNASVPCSRQY